MKEFLALKTKRVFRNDKERKDYVTKRLELTLQKDFNRNGMLCVPVEGDTLMLKEERIAAERVKTESYENKADSKESFKKASVPPGRAQSWKTKCAATIASEILSYPCSQC